MNNNVFPASSPGKGWSPNEVVTHKAEKNSGLVQWWYDLTAIPEAPIDSSFFKREAARKSRLTSAVLFWFSLLMAIFLPCCLFLTNKFTIWMCGLALIGGLIGLVLNKKGMTITAGIVSVMIFEIALTSVILTTLPMDETSIQLYELYIIAELLAVSLLPIRSVFVVALIDSLFILASIFFQPHNAILQVDLQPGSQLIPVLIRPVGLQIIVAGVAYMWVISATRAIARADRAEMVAKLEHALVDQKRELEEGIEQILQTHVAIANGNLNARAPLTQDNALWQIARALNTLLVRLQRATHAERELQRVEQAVTSTVRIIQQAEQQQQMPRIAFTQTELDPLIVALQGKTIAYTQSPFIQQPPKTPTMMSMEQSPIPQTRPHYT